MDVRKLLMLMALVLSVIAVRAQSFDYYYRGVTFRCKAKNGRTAIKGFDRKAAKVVIPADVKDKNGRVHKVSTVDLFQEATIYKTNIVVIESGITEISDWCFLNFKDLQEVYIPNSTEKIGTFAFNGRHLPKFKMPSTIKEYDLAVGKAVFPKMMETPQADPMAGIDLGDYGEMASAEGNVSSGETPVVSKPVGITPGTSDIDFNIPTTHANRENTFCVIIANEKYVQKDTPSVKYAAQDGKTFEDYCLRTLGLPKENMRFMPNASYLQMKSVLEWFKQIGDVYGKDANFIVYYAGHGIPDEKGNCKLIPADVSINDVGNGFGLKELYESLGKLTQSNVLVLIDACFSGNDREDIAALDETHRGIVREVKQDVVQGNVVVLTAASGTETALSYDEKGHGLFSYYLMKKIQDTKGDVTYGDLYNYVKKEVMRKSIVSKGKKQTPCVSVSAKMANNWKNIKI